MEINEVIREIKSKFRLFMNGVISQSFREKGLQYRLIFGIELPRIKEIAAQYDRIVFFAEGVLAGGIAEKLCAALRKRGFRGSFDMVGIDRFVPAAAVDEQLAMFGLYKESMIRRLR